MSFTKNNFNLSPNGISGQLAEMFLLSDERGFNKLIDIPAVSGGPSSE